MTETLVNGSDGAHVNGKLASIASLAHTPSDDNPYVSIIESLRSQNNELFSQVTALNSKLVQSYDRVSNLEDHDHLTQTNLRNLNKRIAELEMERMEHLSALDTGLLVEKAHVTSELSRLMEKATEEAAQRGEAENAKQQIEKDLDDLSATLFNQANTMVAEARFARAQSEKKAVASEEAMRNSEEMVAAMQIQMQALSEAKDAAERDAAEMRERIEKGKFVERKRTTSLISSGSGVQIPRLIKGHLPYEEFLNFITHLRTLRPTVQHPPALASLISLPFLARLIAEDSDPTLRLDLAPSLNWLTRRSIAGAVQQGQLEIEPMHFAHLVAEISANSISAPLDICCALCGKSVLRPLTGDAAPPPSHPSIVSRPTLQNAAASWVSTSRFFRSSLGGSGRASPVPQTSVPASPTSPAHFVYAFRVAVPSSPKIAPHALCSSGWCLARLRTTCELWRYVRTGLIERLWEDYGTLAKMAPKSTAISRAYTPPAPSISLATPPVPPRRRIPPKPSTLWEKGLGALGVDSAVSSGGSTPMERTQTAPAAIGSPAAETPSEVVPHPTGPPPAPPPRRVPPPPAHGPAPVLPPRSNARRPLSSSPEKQTNHLPNDQDDFVTPRSSMDGGEKDDKVDLEPAKEELKEETETATVVLNDEDAKSKYSSEGVVAESAPTKAEEIKTDAPEIARPASPIRRPSTPHSTALPTSAPSTPNTKTTALPATGTPTGSSPAPPPPLPRRAASRRGGAPSTPGNRSPRTSLLMHGVERDGEQDLRRASLGQSIAALISTSPPKGSEGETSRPASPTPAPRGTEKPQSPKLETLAALEVKHEDGVLAESPATDAAPHSAVAKEALSNDPVGKPETTTALEAADGAVADDVKEKPEVEDTKTVEPTTPVAAKRKLPIVPPPLPPRHTPPRPVHDDEDTDKKEEESEEEKSPIVEDPNLYVSEKTWEDKAWKELVRLRADMFWARVGSAKD